jgi:DNA (cytosine-5)-methyltransferase 1
MSKGSGTRSGLLWEVERILTEIRDSNGELPRILFMENVPQVHGKKNINDFEKWLGFLENLGYTNYWQDLNAKNYGVAQNRNRCFMFSFLGNYSYDFPQPIPLKKKLKDYLQDNVEEKYHINNEKAEKLIKKLVDNGTLPTTIHQSRAEQSRAEQTCVDGTINEPQKREVANCIPARYDNGISKRRKAGNLVVENECNG